MKSNILSFKKVGPISWHSIPKGFIISLGEDFQKRQRYFIYDDGNCLENFEYLNEAKERVRRLYALNLLAKQGQDLKIGY
jgi:hypothetical protein